MEHNRIEFELDHNRMLRMPAANHRRPRSWQFVAGSANRGRRANIDQVVVQNRFKTYALGDKNPPESVPEAVWERSWEVLGPSWLEVGGLGAILDSS